MKQSTTSLNHLMNWVQMTRTFAPLLDSEADSLLIKLQQLSERNRHISSLEDAPLTLGIYGHALDGKNHLLSTLQGNPNGSTRRVYSGAQVAMPGLQLDWRDKGTANCVDTSDRFLPSCTSVCVIGRNN